MMMMMQVSDNEVVMLEGDFNGNVGSKSRLWIWYEE
jgi:hypothetical protein